MSREKRLLGDMEDCLNPLEELLDGLQSSMEELCENLSEFGERDYPIGKRIWMEKVENMSADFMDDINRAKEDFTEQLQESFENLRDEIKGASKLMREGMGFSPRIISEKGDWENYKELQGFSLQKDRLSNRYRIIDNDSLQRAIGSRVAMEELLQRLAKGHFLEAGDVIGVHRPGYEHYGIYIGNGKVIHYAAEGGDFYGKICIHEADFLEFLRDGRDYFYLHFEGRCPIKIYQNENVYSGDILLFANINKYKIYSPEETVQRARNRIGEEKYNFVTKNCEHFALWCKTDVEESTQVTRGAIYGTSLASGISPLLSPILLSLINPLDQEK